MRDVHHGHPLIGQLANGAAQLNRLMAGQPGSGLVEDHQPRPPSQDTEDFDLLLIGYRQRPDTGIQRHREAMTVDERFDPPTIGPVVDEQPGPLLRPEDDVVHDTHGGQQREFLGHADQAKGSGFGWPTQPERGPVKEHPPLIRLVHTEHNATKS